MTGVELLGIFGLGGITILGVGRWARRLDQPLITRSVRFAPGLREDQVKSLLDVVAALPKRSRVIFETTSCDAQLTFMISATPGVMATIESALSGIAPETSLAEADSCSKSVSVRWRLGWSGLTRVALRTDASASSAASLLGTIASAGNNEAVSLRHELRPAGNACSRPGPISASEPTKVKPTGPALRLASEIVISTGHPSRARVLLSRVLTPLRSRVLHGGLRANQRRVAKVVSSVLHGPGAVVTPEELLGILGWPIDSPAVPGVAYDAAPRLARPRSIPRAATPKTPRTWGASGPAGDAVVQPTTGATCHSLIVGPSGSGKSWLMTNLIVGESSTDHAIVLVDMKGDTATDVLSRLSPKRHDDVVVLAPAEHGPVPGLRTFGDSPELSADLWLSVFRGLFPENFGVRSQRYLRMGLNTLARSGGATIAELPRLFQDGSFRRSLVSRLDDPLLIGEWAAFEQLSVAQQSEHLLPALGKVSEVLARKSVRATLAQSTPRITIAEAVRRRKVIVVSLPPGVIGQPAALLLGALVVFEVWQAVMAKQSLSPNQRDHVALYIDEPAVLGSLPIPLDTLLETARGMNCGITLAAQSLRQLPERVSRAALTNASTIATFRPSQGDAALIARELPGLSADQLQRLDPFTIALRLGLSSGVTVPVCTVQTSPLAPETGDAKQLIAMSADRYGVDPDDVDDQLRDRLNVHAGTPTASIGEIGSAS